MIEPPTPPPSWFSLAARRDVVFRALKTAALVGTILLAINHLPALMRGEVTAERIAQIVLTYFVPYAVATFASVQAIRAELTRERLARE